MQKTLFTISENLFEEKDLCILALSPSSIDVNSDINLFRYGLGEKQKIASFKHQNGYKNLGAEIDMRLSGCTGEKKTNRILFVYDLLDYSDKLSKTDCLIIDIKIIVEFLFPGLLDYSIGSVMKQLYDGDDYKSELFTALFQIIYNKCTFSETAFMRIFQGCLARIDHGIAWFLRWFTSNAYDFRLIENSNTNSINNHFPGGPSELEQIIEQTFWGYKYKLNNENEKNDKKGVHEIQEISVEELILLLQDEARLKNEFPKYKYRESQAKYVKVISNGLNTEGTTLIEAGTGTGKTLGYILPSLEFLSKNSHKKIIISTSNKNLQSHIIKVEIPRVKSAFQKYENISIAILKGKSNYFCFQALIRAFYSNFLTKHGDEELKLLCLYIIMLLEIEWGDVETISGGIRINFKKLNEFLYSINSSSNCKENSCFFNKCMHDHIVAFANKARLVITNHHLVFSLGTYILENCDTHIIDEAELFPEAAVSSYTDEVGTKDFYNIINGFLSSKSGLSLHELTTRSLNSKKHGNIEDRDECQKIIGEIESVVKNLKENIDYLSSLLSETTSEEMEEFFLYESVFYKSKINEEKLFNISKLLQLLLELKIDIKKLDTRPIAVGLYQRLFGWFGIIENFLDDFQNSLKNRNNDNFCVTLQVTSKKDWKIISRPLYGEFLIYSHLLSKSKSIIFTSASLALEANKMEFIKESLGLELYKGTIFEEVIATDRNYFNNVEGIIYRGIVEPHFEKMCEQYNSYLKGLNETICYLTKAAKGRSLVLFTSAERMKLVFNEIKKNVEKAGIVPLIQNGTSLSEIELFKKRHASVLFGVNRFWRGVDFPGNTLQQVIIVQLPRPYYLAPLWKQRKIYNRKKMERYYRNVSYFNFRQMVGRLIRSEDDSGIIIVLDSRAGIYQFVSLTRLPREKWMTIDSLEEVGEHIEKYISFED